MTDKSYCNMCDCELPEFQAELHPAHNFNKYVMEQRIRYGGQS